MVALSANMVSREKGRINLFIGAVMIILPSRSQNSHIGLDGHPQSGKCECESRPRPTHCLEQFLFSTAVLMRLGRQCFVWTTLNRSQTTGIVSSERSILEGITA